MRRYNIYWQPRGLAAGGWLCSCEGRSNSSHGILRTLRNLSSPPPRPPARPPALRYGGTLTSPGMAAHSRPQGWRYTHFLKVGGTLTSSGKELYTTGRHGLLLDGVVHHELLVARAVHHGLLLAGAVRQGLLQDGVVHHVLLLDGVVHRELPIAGAVHHGLLLDGVVHHVLLLKGVVHQELLPGGRHRRNDRKKEKLDRIGEKEGIVVSRKKMR